MQCLTAASFDTLPTSLMTKGVHLEVAAQKGLSWSPAVAGYESITDTASGYRGGVNGKMQALNLATNFSAAPRRRRESYDMYDLTPEC